MSGGVMVTLAHVNGERVRVRLSEHDLANQAAFRGAWRRALGWAPPRWTDDEFRDVVRVMQRLADAEARTA